MTAAVAASSAVENALQAEAQSLHKGPDASILDFRQVAEAFDASEALQQVKFVDVLYDTNFCFHAGGCFLNVYVNSCYNSGAKWN